jgi:hypothetical protein
MTPTKHWDRVHFPTPAQRRWWYDQDVGRKGAYDELTKAEKDEVALSYAPAEERLCRECGEPFIARIGGTSPQQAKLVCDKCQKHDYGHRTSRAKPKVTTVVACPGKGIVPWCKEKVEVGQNHKVYCSHRCQDHLKAIRDNRTTLSTPELAEKARKAIEKALARERASWVGLSSPYRELSTTREERSEIARKAARARWGRTGEL